MLQAFKNTAIGRPYNRLCLCEDLLKLQRKTFHSAKVYAYEASRSELHKQAVSINTRQSLSDKCSRLIVNSYIFFNGRMLHSYATRSCLSTNSLSSTFSTRNVIWQDVNSLHNSTILSQSSWCDGNPHGYPMDELQPLLVTKLINDMSFRPAQNDMKIADLVFSDHKRLEILLRVIDILPDYKGSEVCFIGRSNAGKSSLIKSLLCDPPNLRIAISKKPGRTRTLNFYNMGREFSLVDMPGYGDNMPEYYVESVEQYIRSRKNLRRTFLLMESDEGLTDVDKIGIEMMEEFDRPYTIILTKIDKSSHSKVLRNILDIQKIQKKKLRGAFPQIFLVSAHQNIGLSLLRTFILHECGINLELAAKRTRR